MKIKKNWLIYQGSRICYQFIRSQNEKEKPFLIFIHGFLSSQYSFRKMIPHLIERYNIITMDLPPFGDSDRIKSFDYSYKNMADLVIYFMDQHKINQATLVGHSMGGQIALTCAYYYEKRIKKLVLLAPSCYMMKTDNFSYLLTRLPFFKLMIRKLLKRKGVHETLRQSVYNESIITEEMLSTYKKPFLDNKMYICLAKMVRDREGDLSESFLSKISTECLIFWGKHDEILPVSIAYQMAKDLPNTELCTFNYGGHLLPEEFPNVICDYILARCN